MARIWKSRKELIAMCLMFGRDKRIRASSRDGSG
jgi:hypothetical protein